MLQLIDLSKSLDPKENIRAQILTLHELDRWVNQNLLLPAHGSVRRPQRHYVDLKFTDDFFSQYMENGRVMTAIVEFDSNHDIDYSNVFSVLGDTLESPDHFGLRCDAWLLSADDWPLVTVELMARGFEVQKKYNTRAFPNFMQSAIERWFPTADYLTLLDLFKSDMLALEPNKEGIPLLRDVLYDLEITRIASLPCLPDDLTM